jgi:hypothetical protein
MLRTFWIRLLTVLSSSGLAPGPGITKNNYLLSIEIALKNSFVTFVKTDKQETYISYADSFLGELVGTDRLVVTAYRAMMVANQGKHVEAAKIAHSAIAANVSSQPIGRHYHYVAMLLGECSNAVLKDASLTNAERNALSGMYLSGAMENTRKAIQNNAYLDQRLAADLLSGGQLKSVREHPDFKTLFEKQSTADKIPQIR